MISGLPAPGALGIGNVRGRQAGVFDLVDLGDVAELHVPHQVVDGFEDGVEVGSSSAGCSNGGRCRRRGRSRLGRGWLSKGRGHNEAAGEKKKCNAH